MVGLKGDPVDIIVVVVYMPNTDHSKVEEMYDNIE